MLGEGEEGSSMLDRVGEGGSGKGCILTSLVNVNRIRQTNHRSPCSGQNIILHGLYSIRRLNTIMTTVTLEVY